MAGTGPSKPGGRGKADPRPGPRKIVRRPKAGAGDAEAATAAAVAPDAKAAETPAPKPKPAPKPRAAVPKAPATAKAPAKPRAAPKPKATELADEPGPLAAIEELVTANEGAAPDLAAPAVNAGTEPCRINLALQGGGAHGAFTWGVLDRLLEDDGIDIAAISGCSAGALNAAALKSGWVAGGRQGARDQLDWLWGQMGAIPDLSFAHWLMAFMPGPAMTAKMVETVVPFKMIDAVTSAVSPYDLPFWDNPLRRVAERFAYERISGQEGPLIFISATNVRTGKIRVFNNAEISTDVILASACLPTLFRAVEIEDPQTGKTEAYWDGGYAGNPALFPLFAPSLPDDVVIVNINPMLREELPSSAAEIANRVNEISFNSSLLRELRAIAFVKRLLAGGQLQPGSMKDVRVHMIADDKLMGSLSVATKIVPTPTLLTHLKAAGRMAAEDFMESARSKIGKSGTVDLAALLA